MLLVDSPLPFYVRNALDTLAAVAQGHACFCILKQQGDSAARVFAVTMAFWVGAAADHVETFDSQIRAHLGRWNIFRDVSYVFVCHIHAAAGHIALSSPPCGTPCSTSLNFAFSIEDDFLRFSVTTIHHGLCLTPNFGNRETRWVPNTNVGKRTFPSTNLKELRAYRSVGVQRVYSPRFRGV